MIAPQDRRYIQFYVTQEAWDSGYSWRVSEGLANKVLELGEGSVWRYQPPPSPEWPPEHWEYAVGPETLTPEQIEHFIGERYIGDWSPYKVRWTYERLDRKANLTPRQRRAMLGRAEVGTMFLEEEEDERESRGSRPGPRRRRKPRSEIPPGTPIRKLPPAVAGGVLPFDWPNPAMGRNPNRARRLQHPKLVDARRMAKKHPKTFELPSKRAVAALGVGDFAKVEVDGERFWVRVTKRDGAKFQGVVDNDLVKTDRHGLRLGDRIAFMSRNLYDAASDEDMTRAMADRLAANPFRRENLRRRSDKIRELENRLRRLEGHHESIEDILERQNPGVAEARELRKDLSRLETEIEDIEQHIAQLEATIELEGDIIGEPPPKVAWGIVRTRNLSR